MIRLILRVENVNNKYFRLVAGYKFLTELMKGHGANSKGLGLWQ